MTRRGIKMRDRTARPAVPASASSSRRPAAATRTCRAPAAWRTGTSRCLPVQTFQIMAAFAAEDEHLAAEWIGADDLLHPGRQTIEPGPQINRLTGQRHLCSGARALIQTSAAPT